MPADLANSRPVGWRDRLLSERGSLATQRDSFLQEIESIRDQLDRLLDGIDYCFDWKPNDEEWSGREIIYHMVDTPLGGVHVAVWGVLSGELDEISITAGLTNLTLERKANGIAEVRNDLEEVLTGLADALSSATDAKLEERSVPIRAISFSTSSERTAGDLLARTFVHHWQEHLAQLGELREMLGLD